MNSREALIRIILLSLLIYSAASLANAGHDYKLARAKETELFHTLNCLEGENLELRQELENEMSKEELAQLARQRLGLVLPGEKIFYFTTDREG